MGGWFVYFMFLGAGLLVGGAWSMYKTGSLKGTIVLGILAAGALALAFMSYSTQ